jgi:hypothetical protein
MISEVGLVGASLTGVESAVVDAVVAVLAAVNGVSTVNDSDKAAAAPLNRVSRVGGVTLK